MNDLGDFVGYFTVGSTTTGFYVIGSDTNDLVFPGSANTWAHGISLDRKIVGKYNDAGAQIDNEGFMYDYNAQDYEDLTFILIRNFNRLFLRFNCLILFISKNRRRLEF